MENGGRKGALERNSTHGGPGIGDPDWVVARRGLGDKEGEGGGRRLAVDDEMEVQIAVHVVTMLLVDVQTDRVRAGRERMDS